MIRKRKKERKKERKNLTVLAGLLLFVLPIMAISGEFTADLYYDGDVTGRADNYTTPAEGKITHKFAYVYPRAKVSDDDILTAEWSCHVNGSQAPIEVWGTLNETYLPGTYYFSDLLPSNASITDITINYHWHAGDGSGVMTISTNWAE